MRETTGECAIRNRIHLVAVLIGTILLGLASRGYPDLFPQALGKYPGDALWAQMVYWLVCICVPDASVIEVALAALSLSCIDEVSQLYRAPWIDQIRATAPGHLVLGSHFSWLDMLSYAVGIAMVAPVEWLLLRRKKRGR